MKPKNGNCTDKSLKSQYMIDKHTHLGSVLFPRFEVFVVWQTMGEGTIVNPLCIGSRSTNLGKILYHMVLY